MSLTTRDIVNLLSKIKELNYRQFRYDDGDVRLEVSMDADGGSFAQRQSPPSAAAPASVTAQSAPAAAPSPEPAATAASKPAVQIEAQARPGLVAITAPMTGTFYSAPSPGADPFVSERSTVVESDTVGIIEVMKLFNSIRAGSKGRVVEICVANEEQVGTGQTLMWIEPTQAG